MSKTIKERHLEAIVMENTITSIKAYDQAAEKCEAITEEVAIKFAEWCLEHIYNTEHPIDMVNKLKLFKQENGL